MADTDEILLDRKGGLAILTINRPQALNALTLANYRRIDPALRGWAADPSVHAVARLRRRRSRILRRRRCARGLRSGARDQR